MNVNEDVKTPLQPTSGPKPPSYVQPPPGYSAVPSGGPPMSAPYTGGYQPAPANLGRNNCVMVVTTQPTSVNHLPPPPTTWIAWSILSCVFCAWPCGLVAIIYSLQVSNYYGAGYYSAAESASRIAFGWNVASTVLGICSYITTAVVIGIQLSSGRDVATPPPY